jgi:hypothetical protein
MSADALAALAERFRELAGRYEETKAQAEGAVTYWRWADAFSWWDDPRPLAAERRGFRRRRLLASPPDDPGRPHDVVGIDGGGRAVVVRMVGAGGVHHEHFVVRGPELAEATRYEPAPAWEPGPPVLRRLIRVELDGDGLPRAALEYRRGDGIENGDSIASERYALDEDERVVRIEATPEPDPERPLVPRPEWRPPERWRMTWTATYDEDGDLVALDEQGEWGAGAPTSRRVDLAAPDEPEDRSSADRRVWRRPSDAREVAAWARAVEDGLVRRVLELLAAARPAEPLAAVALAYDEADRLPPELSLLLASEREALLAAHPDEGSWYLWNPAEWRAADAHARSLAGDPELDGAMADLSLEWRPEGDHGAARALLNRVAKRLNEADWPVALAPDFVAFATDVELCETADNLRAALPRGTLRRLRRRDWLPYG